jgi:hypothetical protein
MDIQDMVARLELPDLATLRINAERLALKGTTKQKEQATKALEVIDAEQAKRASLEPPPKRKVREKRTKAAT